MWYHGRWGKDSLYCLQVRNYGVVVGNYQDLLRPPCWMPPRYLGIILANLLHLGSPHEPELRRATA